MPETQLASMFIGSADDGDGIDRGRLSDAGNMIHIINPQTGEILDYITLDKIIEDTHKKSLESYIETYDAIVLGGNNFSYDQYLEKRNHIIIPDEDGTYQEFVLFEVDKYRDTEGRKTHFYAHATYLELKKAKVIYPTRREGFTLSQHAGWALNDTGWRVGIVESEETRTFNIENHTNPYEFIKRLANEFEVEIRFRVEHDGRRITARYVDFLERIGDWKGREVEFGKDLDSIRRIEKQDVVTALLGLGPEREDGTRLEVLVEDEEALQRWGRVDEHGNLHHLIEPYEIQSERTEMTEEEARRYTRTALDKRINTQVTYETTILDLEEVPGLEHEKIRFGDTIRIKDTYFNPPLYLEARVYEMERSIKSKVKKDIKLGDYIEYTEEEVNAIWNQLRNEIIRRMNRLAIVSITSTAGNVFKNAQGTTELTARTFVNGAERDEDGTLYDYQWMRFDKDGNHDTNFYAEGKTITVTANDIDEKATYRVLVAYELEVINTAEITISNVFDGEDGEPGPPGPKGDKGEDGKTFYTWIKYADTPTSGMSDSPEGKEYIGIAYNKETPTPSTNYSDYIWAKFKGEQGIPGPPGEDGQPTYIWVKYADDEHGNGMSDSPDGKLYIGLAFNKTTPTESNNPADYTWSLMPQNIEIGGRNLIGNSDYRKTPEAFNSTVQVISGNPNSVLVTRTGSEGWGVISERITNIVEGQVYTLSFELKTNDVARLNYIYIFDSDEGNRHIPVSIGITADGQWHKYTVTFTSSVTRSNAGIMIATDYKNTPGNQFELRKLKLELGHKATDWTPAPEDVQAEIDEAKQEAEEAKQEAQQAQTTADGKNTIIPSKTEPPTEGRKIGDAWFQEMPDGSLVIHDFNGVEWVKRQFGEQSIIANSITANHIKSLVGLNVNNQFVVDSQGNVKFAGSLEGATGVFSGEIKTKKLRVRADSVHDFYDFGIEIETAQWQPDLNNPFVRTGYISFNTANDALEIYRIDNNGVYRPLQGFSVEAEQVLFTGKMQLIPDQTGSYGNVLSLSGGSSDHVYIEFYRSSPFERSAYIGIPSRNSQHFVINAHGITGELRLSGADVYVSERLINPAAYQTTTSSAANCYVATTGHFARSTSSKRYKQDIRYCDVDYKKILNLKQASWYDKGEVERNEGTTEGLRRYYGAIAEDFERIGLPEYIIYNEETGEVENFSDRAWVLLIPNINDVLEELEQIKERLERLENEGNSV